MFFKWYSQKYYAIPRFNAKLGSYKKYYEKWRRRLANWIYFCFAIVYEIDFFLNQWQTRQTSNGKKLVAPDLRFSYASAYDNTRYPFSFSYEVYELCSGFKLDNLAVLCLSWFKWPVKLSYTGSYQYLLLWSVLYRSHRVFVWGKFRIKKYQTFKTHC